MVQRLKKPIDELAEADDQHHGHFETIASDSPTDEACTMAERLKRRRQVLEQHPYRRCYELAVARALCIWGSERPSDADLRSTRERPCDLPVQLLQVCRQFYTEASPVFWTTNEFSSSCPQSYDHFMADLSAAQKATITKVHLDVEFFWHSDDWESIACSWKIIRPLRNLKSLSLYIQPCFEVLTAFRPQFSAGRLERLQRYTILPLQHVDVLVRNFKVQAEPYAMSHEKCVTLAEDIRQRLLDADGARNIEVAAQA